ncbi:MAG: helix-turn-helix domain-containing protein [Steroidobacteraceae bacterium]
MARGYGQYCPLALAAELLCERWTILIVSRVVDGCESFGEIQRGVPRCSPSLLSQRLDQLVRAGILERTAAKRGRKRIYRLTPAGRDLEPMLESLAVWGQNWGRDMVNDDMDPAFLAWSMHTRLDTDNMPPGRTVMQFHFVGAPADTRRFWLINDSGVVEMCLKDPGYDVDLHVRAELRLFIETWRGFRDLRAELRSGHIVVTGPARLVRQFPRWLKLSMLAPYPRKRSGRESALAEMPRL